MVKKLAAAVSKQRHVSLKINPQNKTGTLTKLMLTKTHKNKLNKNKPFILNLSATQIITMAHRIEVEDGFFGPALSVIARTLLPKLLPVLGTLGLAAASGAVSGATKKAVFGDGIVRGNGIKKIFV